MSILKPTLGELLDRYTIELLKDAHDPNPDSAELMNLEDAIRGEMPSGADLVLDAVRLAIMNARIWELRDAAVQGGVPVTLREADHLNHQRRQHVRNLDR